MRILLVMERGAPGMGWVCERELIRLGHEVEVEDNRTNHLPFGGPTVWSYGSLAQRARMRAANDVLVNRAVRAHAARFEPELVLVGKGENLSVETVRWLGDHTPAVLFNWNLDNPFYPGNTSLDHLASMPHYHGYGVFARHFAPVVESLGCPRVEFLPCYYSPDAHPAHLALSAEDERAYGCDVVFAGNWSPEREAALLPLADQRLAIWGWLWDRLPPGSPLRACFRGRGVIGEEYARATLAAKCVVNVLNQQGKGANNLRTFEATGLGRMLITEYSEEQASTLFVEDREIVCFRSPAELREKVLHFLANADEREAIARRGQARTWSEHTLTHRLERCLAAVTSIRGARGGA